MNATLTAAQVAAAIKVAHVVYECIVANGPNGIPSGHLYAATMNAFEDVYSYEACVGMLVQARLVRRDGFVLYAQAPGAADCK